MKIYHNPRCSKSRQALAILEEAGLKPEVILYLDDPPTPGELEGILDGLGLQPEEIIRKGESVYRELGLADREMNREELVAILVQNPILIQRPIVVKGSRAVVGRPPEKVQELIG